MPCGIDKYNSYRKYGETLLVTQTSNFGVFRAGHVVRVGQHQPPSVSQRSAERLGRSAVAQVQRDLLDQLLPALRRVRVARDAQVQITPGVKFAGYTIDILHHADDGATVGLNCSLHRQHRHRLARQRVSDTGSFLRRAAFARHELSHPAQLVGVCAGRDGQHRAAQRDLTTTTTRRSGHQPSPATADSAQAAEVTTYQIGTVYKGQKFTLDADMLSHPLPEQLLLTIDLTSRRLDLGDTIYYLQPSSITQGWSLKAPWS